MRIVLGLILMLLAAGIRAQPEYITSMKVTQDGDRIIIDYDLKKMTLDPYYYTVDLEVLEEGRTIYPSAACLSGDISGPEEKHFIPGELKKRIYWTPLREPALQELKGEISFRLKARLYSKVFGGPESAFSSLLVPGLGQYKVNKKKGPYFLIAGAAYGLVGTGIYFRTQYNKTYDEYITSRDPQKISTLRDKYEGQLSTSNLLLIGGGAIWLGDVVWVALKGRKNKKAYQRLTAYSNIEFDGARGWASYGINIRF